MNSKQFGSAIGIVTGIGIVAFLFIFFIFPNSPTTVSANSTSTIQTTSPDPYTMSCDQLHQTILTLQQRVVSDTFNQQATADGVYLNYYTQVYNERISLSYGSLNLAANPIPNDACLLP